MAAGRFSQRVRVGAVVERSFSTWMRNAPAFIGVTVLFNLPALAVNVWAIFGVAGYAEALLGEESVEADTTTHALQIVMGLVSFLLSMIVTGAICHATFQHLRGERPDMGVSTRRGLSRMFVLLLTSFLGGLITAALGLVAAIPAVILGMVLGDLGAILGGLVAFVVVMFVVISVYVAVPAAAVEPLSPMEAVKRSWELAKERRLTVFGIIFVIGLIVGIPTTLLSAMLYGMLGAVGAALVTQVIGLVFASLFSTSQAVIYHDLRVDKEGLGDDDLINVFS